MIFNKKDSKLSHLVSLNLDTVGIRIPNHDFPLEIVKLLNRPIITTSVNIHNTDSLYDLKEIQNEFKGIDIFFDENFKYKSLGSTIIDLTQEQVKILRQGDGVFKS